MQINYETHYIRRDELLERVRNGYQYAILHKDALDIKVPKPIFGVYALADDSVADYMSLSGVRTVLGSDFKPVSGYISKDMVLVHFSFDEKKVNGLREQDEMMELLKAHGFVNLRDLNDDGINDTEIDEIDYSVMQANTKYFMFVSAREVKYVKRVENEDGNV